MSDIENLEESGVFTKAEAERFKKIARQRAAVLKRERTRTDKIARKAFQFYINNGRSWKGQEMARAVFRAAMVKRHKLHQRIARLVPEPVEPEWDSE